AGAAKTPKTGSSRKAAKRCMGTSLLPAAYHGSCRLTTPLAWAGTSRYEAAVPSSRGFPMTAVLFWWLMLADSLLLNKDRGNHPVFKADTATLVNLAKGRVLRCFIRKGMSSEE